MNLFIQLPCFNEEHALPVTLRNLPKALAGIERIVVVVIDDGSSDRTSEVAKELGVDVIVRHTQNRGLAAAFTSGLDACIQLGADIIVNTDADNQYPGVQVERLIAPILNGHADIVIGDRRPAHNRHFSQTKRVLQRLGSLTVGALAGRHIPDPVSGFRALSRDAAMRLNIVTSFSYTVESVLQAGQKGLAIAFVPIDTNATLRKSRLFRSIPEFMFRSLSTMLRIYAMYKPLKVFVTLSAILLFVGTMPIARFLYLYMIGEGAGHVQSLVLGGVLCMSGCLTMALGIVADLISCNRRLLELTLEKVRRLEAYASQGDGNELWTKNRTIRIVEQQLPRRDLTIVQAAHLIS